MEIKAISDGESSLSATLTASRLFPWSASRRPATMDEGVAIFAG